MVSQRVWVRTTVSGSRVRCRSSTPLPPRSTGVGAPNVLHHALRSRVAVAGFEHENDRAKETKLQTSRSLLTMICRVKQRGGLPCQRGERCTPLGYIASNVHLNRPYT